MNQNHANPAFPNPALVLFIIAIYLLMFISGLGTSCYLLEKVITLKPVVLIDLLKYTLLCAIFLVLMVNGLKALTLREIHLQRLESGVKNFKWLFVITLMIALAVKYGMFSENIKENRGELNLIEISYLHIVLLAAAAGFCAWSHRILTINISLTE